jgi:arylsulfatase
METFAGFLTHTDAQVQRVLDFIDELGEGDDTIVIVMSDNGASAEGGAKGSFNEQYFFNFVPESMDENLRRIDDLGTPRANNHYPWGWAWAGNTPLKRFKRDTHEGGVADPMIVHWPTRLGAGGTRHQYVHAIDVMPTLLDLIGIEPPSVIGGIDQTPIEGVSFAGTLTDPSAPARHVTQYYEMLGSRALYHDGWKSVVFHPTPFIAYDGTDVSKPFDDDVWELYHVAEDFSEVDDLAEKEPEQLEKMKELWWVEAAKYQVLPLNNAPGKFPDRRWRRERYELYSGIGPLPEVIAPNLRNRGFTIAAALTVPAAGPVDGVVVAQGSHSGGYALYVKGRRLHFAYNFVGTEITVVPASAELPVGLVEVKVVVTRGEIGTYGVELWYGDVPVGEGKVERRTPITYGMTGFAVGYQPGGSICPDLEGRAEITTGVLGKVVIEPEGRPEVDRTKELRKDLATQ